MNGDVLNPVPCLGRLRTIDVQSFKAPLAQARRIRVSYNCNNFPFDFAPNNVAIVVRDWRDGTAMGIHFGDLGNP